MAHAARSAIFGVKNDGAGFHVGESMIEFVVRRLRESTTGSILDGLFSPDALLIPVPGHAPLLQRTKQQLWAMKRLCEAMRTTGLGAAVAPLLERVESVPAAHLLGPGQSRPNARRHFETVRVNADLVQRSKKLVLVDDVLTRGSTLMGCASRLREFFPDASIVGFAVARTRSEPCEISTPISPGLHRVVRWGDDDCNVEESGQSLA